jgi:hypothetical protein
MLNIRLNLVSQRSAGARGVKTVTFDGSFTPSVKTEDVVPKTEWVDKNYEANVKLGINSVGDLLKLVPFPTPGVTTDVSFTYKLDPKNAKVISGAAANSARWRFEASGNQYLDGGLELMVLFARPRNLEEVALNVPASATYDIRGHDDIVYTKVKPVKIRFKKSQIAVVAA